jgi:hypothetical protein
MGVANNARQSFAENKRHYPGEGKRERVDVELACVFFEICLGAGIQRVRMRRDEINRRDGAIYAPPQQ